MINKLERQIRQHCIPASISVS